MNEKEYSGEIMSWRRCELEFVRKVEVDNERIHSILNKAEQRLNRAKNTPINKENVSFIIEDYYEVIKELLTSYLLKNGLKSSNHQCLISFFYEKNKENEREARLIQQMSFFRNRLTYYGEDVPLDFYEDNKEEFDKIIALIKMLIGGKK